MSVAESKVREEPARYLAEVFTSGAGLIGDPEQGQWVAIVMSKDEELLESAGSALTQLGIDWYDGSRLDEDGYRHPEVITICGRENLLRLRNRVGAELADPEKRRQLEILATGSHWQREEAPPELGELILAKKREGLSDKEIAAWLTRWGEPLLTGRREWTKTAVDEIRRDAEAEETLRFITEAIAGAWSKPECEKAAAYLAAVLSGPEAEIGADAVVFTRGEEEESRYVPEALERLGIGYQHVQDGFERTTGFSLGARKDVLRLAAAAGARVSDPRRRKLLYELALHLLWGPYRIPPTILTRMQLRREEGMSAPELARRMNAAKVPPAGGAKSWSAPMVRNALRAGEIEAALTAALA